jgi:hypothetical protein
MPGRQDAFRAGNRPKDRHETETYAGYSLMAAKRRSETVPIPALIATEIVNAIFTFVPAVLAWGTVVVLLRRHWDTEYFWLFLVLSPWIAVLSLTTAVALFRLVAPRLKPGIYPMGMNRGMFGWYCNLALNRAVRVSALWPLVNSSHVLKFLYFRAMGARIAFGINTSLDITFVDMPLISIGKGCTLSEGLAISCHTFVGDKLLLKPVTIGRNVFLGMDCLIGLGSRIEDEAWIGMSNLVANQKLTTGFVLDDFAWDKGKPKAAAQASAPSPASSADPE